ncbi:MAG TPA: alpha/beta fold hydrolase [Gaiellaceae bacterium]|nr:alpha/beta fold hydrolase [Gaiellaceae bacterium]
MTVTHEVHGLVVTDHELSLPLDHADPAGRRIDVFAREIAADEGRDRPFLVFFQGGPGSEAPRPTSPKTPSWLGRALEDYRVLMLDQRGTGRSTPVGTLPGLSPQEQYEYLVHHRADAIVRDAEAFRQQLGVERWSVLGQSFGGFCVVTYLSFFAEGLRESFVTGGLPPIARPTEDVYAATYATVRERNRRFYERYPEDRRRVLALHERLAGGELRLPSGDVLTPRRFRQLGGMLGMSDGAERLHYLLDLPPGSPAFGHDVESATHFARNPLYAIVHEACYADGCMTRWAAERAMPEDFASSPELFTGEMVYPWMFEDYGALAPLQEAAELLAQHDWPRLYDGEALERNEVPAAAIVYAEDMYVERAFSEETAARIRGLRPWLTNEFEHDGLRQDRRVFERLLDLAKGKV